MVAEEAQGIVMARILMTIKGRGGIGPPENRQMGAASGKIQTIYRNTIVLHLFCL